MARPLTQYVQCTAAVPAAAAASSPARLLGAPWTMARHRSFPSETKPWIVNVFLCARRIATRQVRCFVTSLPILAEKIRLHRS